MDFAQVVLRRLCLPILKLIRFRAEVVLLEFLGEHELLVVIHATKRAASWVVCEVSFKAFVTHTLGFAVTEHLEAEMVQTGCFHEAGTNGAVS